MIFSKRHISPILGSLHSLISLKNLIPKDLPFLPFYHGIGDTQELPHIKHLYEPSNAQKFEADLDYILSIFKPISLSEFILYSKNEIQFNEPVFHLSFDDGLRQVYDIALPILDRKGIPATIFVNPNFVDNKELFFRYQISLVIEKLKNNNQIIPKELYKITDKRNLFLKEIALENEVNFKDFLNKYQPYMTTEQLKDWTNKGFTLGGHSLDHPYYHLIDKKEQKRQTLGSIHYLKEQFNIDYSAFAFPFSDEGIGNHLLNELHQNHDFDISFGTSGVKKDSLGFHFQRTGMELGSRSAADVLLGEYLYYQLAGIMGKNVRVR